MASLIESLPVEVFETITSNVDLETYRQLRLSSRQLNWLSFSTFAKRHYSELTTTLGSPSLDRLVTVSNHESFGNCVTQLNIKLLNHNNYKDLKAIRSAGIFPPPKRFHTVPGIKSTDINGESTLYDDLIENNNPKCVTDRLIRSLSNFKNLKVIHFRAQFNEPGGWRHTDEDQSFRRKCFDAVLFSIMESSIQLEQFSMCKGDTTIRKGADLECSALRLPLPKLTSLSHSFKHLQSLTLALVAAHNGNARIPGWENGVSQFIACAPELKYLALRLDRNARRSHYSAAVIRSLASSCRLPSLETLRIENCTLHQHELDQFLTAHAGSLAALVLTRVQLLSGDWVSCWNGLKRLRCLQFLKIRTLDHADTGVLACLRDKVRAKVVLDVVDSGRAMEDLLDELIDSCTGKTGVRTTVQEVVE
jgi:hypothetical protein